MGGAAECGDALGDLPDGSRVAFVTMLGSLCPITRAHLQMFEEAQKLLLLKPRTDLGVGPFAACLGRISLNPDRHVTQKLEERGEMAPLSQDQRQKLVELATSDAGMVWVKHSDAPEAEFEGLKRQWPHLRFDWAVLNGADDVVKYKKWRRSMMITMGRPGKTEELKEGMLADGVQESASFVLGPDLPDISSTAARAAAHSRNREELVRHVHPKVADLLLTFEERCSPPDSNGASGQRCIRCNFLKKELSDINTTPVHERMLKNHFKEQGWSEEETVEKLAATIGKISCQSEAARSQGTLQELKSKGREQLIKDYVGAVRALADTSSLPALDLPDLDPAHWQAVQHGLLSLKRKEVTTTEQLLATIRGYQRDLRGLWGLVGALEGSGGGDKYNERKFFEETLPCIASAALSLRNSMAKHDLSAIHVLPQLREREAPQARALPREVCKCLIANMFLCAFKTEPRIAGMPKRSFLKLLANEAPHEQAKLRMFIHYFDRTTTTTLTIVPGNLHILRRRSDLKVDDVCASTAPLLEMQVSEPRV